MRLPSQSRNVHDTARISLAEWAALPDDVRGELDRGGVEEEEMPTVLHEAVVAWLVAALYEHVGRRGGRVFGSELKYAVGPRQGRKPDISVFLKGTARPRSSDKLVRQRPDIAIEVVTSTPRDERRDRVAKVHAYARFGVPQYWIVHPELQTIEIYTLGRDGLYERAVSGTTGRVRVPRLRWTLDLDRLWNETAD